MASPIFISRPSAGFTPISVVRGVQLTILGTYRALKNPELAKHGYYQKAIIAVFISIVVQVILWLPLVLSRWTISAFSSGTNRQTESIIDTLRFLQNNVFNIGPLLISGIRFFKPEMDDLFLMSLKFVDKVYKGKHPESDRQYYTPLLESGKHFQELQSIGTKNQLDWVDQMISGWIFGNDNTANDNTPTDSKPSSAAPKPSTSTRRAFISFLRTYILRSGTTLLALLFSHVPIIGPLVLPLVSFISFNSVAGTTASLVVFAVGFMVPRRIMIVFLSSFWGSRSLVRELLIPYFSRVPFSKPQKARWFANRQGIMFGFGAGFYLFMKIPFVGVLVYGLAEASAAYLITKVSDPLPLHAVKIPEWTELQSVWTANDVSLTNRIDEDGFSTTEFSSSSMPGGWSS